MRKKSRSVPRGGPATINGVLYQLLWSLFRTSRARIRSVSADASGNFEEVNLTLEPVGGGGDLVVMDESRRLVEQLKARPSGRTWSLREVIEDVIPDLYLGYSDADGDSAFRFVTEGRMGQWKTVYNFFRSLRTRTCPEGDSVSGLDAVEKLTFVGPARFTKNKPLDSFWDADEYTEATLFERIVSEVRKRKIIKDSEDESTTQKNLWSLLGNFEFVDGQDAAVVQAKIDSDLLAVVDHHENIARIRDSMALDLGRRASEGGAAIDARAFFSEHGLNAVPLTDWSTLRAASSRHIDSYVRLHAYEATLDVRSARAISVLRDWPQTTPILAITGESGQGKSWHAYRTAVEAGALPQIAVVVDATGNAESTIKRAASVLWQEIAGHDAEIPLSRIAERVRRVIANRLQPWLTLVVDGVQDLNEATELVRQPWQDWGVRLVFTCHSKYAAMVEQESLGRCQTISVSDFDVEELHEFLRRCLGEEWPAVPDTVWFALKRPLMANLYRQIVGDPGWRPESEYELYSEFWKRLVQDAPLDGAYLKRLANGLLTGASYPWSEQQLADAGVEAKSLKHIERCGWIYTLQGASGPRFEIAHDRLLNWLVAATLVDSLRDGKETVESVGNRLRNFLNHQVSVGNRNMGFVPMDFLWMALHDNCLKQQVPNILPALEQSRVRPDDLYASLVPTLGACAVDALAQRAKDVIDDGMLSRTLADAIGVIGGDAATEVGREFLMGTDMLLQRSAMRILACSPAADVLDRLWELHVVTQESPDEYLRELEYKPSLNEESYGALRACCRINPMWLDGAIQRADPTREPVHTLAYLVAAVAGKEGSAIWQRHKSDLRRKVARDKQRSIAACIRRFMDAEEIEWLADNVGHDTELVGPMALSALAQLAPDIAIDRLDSLPRNRLPLTRKWYAGQLFAREPDKVRSKLLRMMQVSSDPWAVAGIYRDFEHYLDATTLSFLLDDLEARLEDVLADENWGTPEPLCREMELLAALGTIEQLHEFQSWKDSHLESMLIEFLLRVGPRRGVSQNSMIRDSAIEVLYRIGGAGFSRVVNEFLQCESRYGRLHAIGLAAKRPNESTISLLTAITESSETWDGHYVEQCHAAECLADNDVWPPVLRLVERIGLKTPREINDVARYGRRPSAELTQVTRNRVAADGKASAAGDVLAIGLGGQESDAVLVRSVLANSAPDGELAHACVIALELLCDRSEESVSLLSQQLEFHAFSATNALIANGTQAALQSLREYARGRFDFAISINLVNRLDDNSEVLLEVRTAVEAELQRHGLADFNTEFDMLLRNVQSSRDVATLLDSRPIRTHLRETSFSSEGPSWCAGSKAAAIRCLARFDPHAAFLAAKTALRNVEWHDRDFYPQVLMEIDERRAIPLLLEQLAVEESERVVRAICRAQMTEATDSILAEYLHSSDTDQRTVGCIATGWAGRSPESVTRLGELLSDVDDDVVRAAGDALSRIDRRNAAREIATAIGEAEDNGQRWVLLDSLLSMADPGDRHRDWPTEGPNIREVLSPLQARYATDCLKRLREKSDR